MKSVAQSRVVTFKPYPHRAEQCALGLLVWLPDGTVRAHPATSLRKARAIDPACDINSLREGMHAVAEELTRRPDALRLYQSGVGAIRVATDAGMIEFASEEELQSGVQWSLAMAAEPHKPVMSHERAPISRLFLQVKQAFSAYGWMAEPGQTLADHKIIARYPIALAEGLTVDFALQNGALHCMQTVDFRTTPADRRQEATAKFLTLGYAPQIVGGLTARRYAIMAGCGAPQAAAASKLAERVADDVFLTESAHDMNRLFAILAQAVGQMPLPQLRT